MEYVSYVQPWHLTGPVHPSLFLLLLRTGRVCRTILYDVLFFFWAYEDRGGEGKWMMNEREGKGMKESRMFFLSLSPPDEWLASNHITF